MFCIVDLGILNAGLGFLYLSSRINTTDPDTVVLGDPCELDTTLMGGAG